MCNIHMYVYFLVIIPPVTSGSIRGLTRFSLKTLKIVIVNSADPDQMLQNNCYIYNHLRPGQIIYHFMTVTHFHSPTTLSF